MTMFRRAMCRLRSTIGGMHADERGDVPGWVLITLMTAGLSDLFQQAIARVSGL